MSAAPVWVSTDLNVARERVRWFPALVSNHVVDLVSRYKPEELPSTLTSYIRNRGQYDYRHHCEVESDNAKFRSEEHTSELQSRGHLVCRLLLEKNKRQLVRRQRESPVREPAFWFSPARLSG